MSALTMVEKTRVIDTKVLSTSLLVLLRLLFVLSVTPGRRQKLLLLTKSLQSMLPDLPLYKLALVAHRTEGDICKAIAWAVEAIQYGLLYESITAVIP